MTALTRIPLEGGPGTVTVLYAFHSECGFCDDVAPAWARPFLPGSAGGARGSDESQITQDAPEAAAAYAEQFGWQIELLSVVELG